MKTPETGASGASILMNSQYRRRCILRLPPRPTLQLSPAVMSWWLRRFENLDFHRVLDSGSTGGQLPVSDRRCIAQLDRLRTSDSRRLFRASGRPAAISSTRVERSFLRQGRQSTSDSHRRRPLARLAQPPVFTGCCPCPPAGSASDLHRLLHPPASPAVNRSTFVEQPHFRLGLRCTPCFNRTLHRRLGRR